mmetsp:Transcript_23693/g.59718  ORF Transcript_23693/g.59718 Transcript_23693/m.59718 type:complete len:82 (+) Transcript_23693:1318-1563(+)
MTSLLFNVNMHHMSVDPVPLLSLTILVVKMKGLAESSFCSLHANLQAKIVRNIANSASECVKSKNKGDEMEGTKTWRRTNC